MTKRTIKSTRQTDGARDDWDLVGTILSSSAFRTAYLFGAPGIGKTWTAYNTGVAGPVYAVTLTEETPSAELRGHYVPVEGRLEWRDGPFTQAMRQGARLVINEITRGSPDVLSMLFPVLESVETARLTLPTNETVAPTDGFCVVATDNAPPDELPEALRDRFDCIVELKEPHPEAFKALTPALRKAAKRTHGLQPERRVSIRSWLAVQRFAPELGMQDAFRAVFGEERGRMLFDAVGLSMAGGRS